MTRRPDLRAASRRAAIVLAGVALIALPGSARAQGALEEARRLRDAGEVELAATMLRQRLARAPGDVDARWLLAETLYWTGDIEGARAEYARALADRPGDPGLRLDYARFLVETGRASQADGVLAPLAARPPPGWEAEVRRVERAILAATAPWARIAPSVRDDSQPLTRLAIEVEAGFRPADGLSVAARVTPQRYEADRGASGGKREVAGVEALAEMTYRRAGSPVAVAVTGGVLTRDEPEATDAIGEARLAALLPRGIELRVAASREPYLWTVASLGRTVLSDAVEVALDRSGAPGWAFEVGGRRETFVLGESRVGDTRTPPEERDDNAVTSAWAWALAPLWTRERASFRAGYAFQWEDSEESRFTGSDYDPYYTPEEVRVHNAIAAVALRPTPAVTVHVDGAVGLFAEEHAPQVPPPFTAPGPGRGPPGPDITFVDRDFTPWRARAVVTAAVGAAGELRAEIERSEDAFFEITRGAVSLTWWLVR